MKKYGQEEWIHTEGLIKRDAYYKFNTVLQHNLRQLENEAVEFDIDQIISQREEESLAWTKATDNQIVNQLKDIFVPKK